jgi:hypothetical protein
VKSSFTSQCSMSGMGTTPTTGFAPFREVDRGSGSDFRKSLPVGFPTPLMKGWLCRLRCRTLGIGRGLPFPRLILTFRPEDAAGGSLQRDESLGALNA